MNILCYNQGFDPSKSVKVCQSDLAARTPAARRHSKAELRPQRKLLSKRPARWLTCGCAAAIARGGKPEKKGIIDVHDNHDL